jgi:hypothetical protein
VELTSKVVAAWAGLATASIATTIIARSAIAATGITLLENVCGVSTIESRPLLIVFSSPCNADQ